MHAARQQAGAHRRRRTELSDPGRIERHLNMWDLLENVGRTVVNTASRAYQCVADVVSPDDEDAIVGVAAFPRTRQRDGFSCGPRSVLAVARHFGYDLDHDEVAEAVGTTEEGTAATPMIAYLRSLGLRSGHHSALRLASLEAALAAGKIAIVDLGGTHWSVAHAMNSSHVWMADPSSFSTFGGRTSRAKFRSRWSGYTILVSAPVPRRAGRAPRRRGERPAAPRRSR